MNFAEEAERAVADVKFGVREASVSSKVCRGRGHGRS